MFGVVRLDMIFEPAKINNRQISFNAKKDPNRYSRVTLSKNTFLCVVWSYTEK